jgi:hypothetical protein
MGETALFCECGNLDELSGEHGGGIAVALTRVAVPSRLCSTLGCAKVQVLDVASNHLMRRSVAKV